MNKIAELKKEIKTLEEEVMNLITDEDASVCIALIRQTPERCWQAIRENPDALANIKNPTREMCIYASKKSGWAFENVPEKVIDADFIREILDEDNAHSVAYELKKRKLWTKEIALMWIKEFVPRFGTRALSLHLPEELRRDPDISKVIGDDGAMEMIMQALIDHPAIKNRLIEKITKEGK